jgi:hypothetical protein
MRAIGVLSPVQSEYGAGIAAAVSSDSNGRLVMRCCVVLCVVRLMVSGYLVAAGVPMCRTTRERADTGHSLSVTHVVGKALLGLVGCGLSTVKLYGW